MTPKNINMTLSSNDLNYCHIKIKYKDITSKSNQPKNTTFIHQSVINKTIPEIHQYLDKFIPAIEEIKTYINDDYVILSVEKIILNFGEMRSVFKQKKINKKLTKKKTK